MPTFINNIWKSKGKMTSAFEEFSVGPLSVRVFGDRKALGMEAAREAASLIQQAIRERGRARLVFSAANSQLEMVESLTASNGIDWKSVEVFHVDEYAGMPLSHSASFAGWVKRNVVDRVHPGKAHFLAGDAPDRIAEFRRYAALLSEAPLDISFLGFGENGHIGFNDPHEADFQDRHLVRSVSLDERCRLQQVMEGHWPDLNAVPKEGITLTCPVLVSADHIICCVPDLRKAEAVRDALEGPVSPSCPGSLVRTHPRAQLYLDRQSASLLSREIWS